MGQLKNIIFDLGGVLLNIDYYITEQAFRDMGFLDFEKMYSQYSADAVFEKLETGDISNESFYNTIIERANSQITREQIALAWNAMLLDFREETLDFLESLGPGYDLYLLSNTNAIHLAAFNEIFFKQTGKTSLNNYFKKAYYSHEVGLRKPNEDIFEFVLKDAGLLAEESLFIDDSYNNIHAAQMLGFTTHLLVPGEKVENLKGYW
ncbi:MAG: HAD family phosphatase [Gloeobacteraceae cyanobacterium ES-bin-316]|nr:HAD family phosphatase [Ferruginibacter sp.]